MLIRLGKTVLFIFNQLVRKIPSCLKSNTNPLLSVPKLETNRRSRVLPTLVVFNLDNLPGKNELQVSKILFSKVDPVKVTTDFRYLSNTKSRLCTKKKIKKSLTKL